MPPRVAATAAAASLLILSGVLYHALASDSAQLDPAAARVAEVPMTVGVWQGHDETTDDTAFAQAGAKGYWMRTYTHRDTKASVLAILMCGRAGKMAVHTPEVCYRGAGYELQTDARPLALDNERGKLWTAAFTKAGKTPTQLRLYWGWNARGSWDAPTSPRWQYRSEPFLYKLYVSRDVTNIASGTLENDPATEFLRDLVPVLEKTLFPAID